MNKMAIPMLAPMTVPASRPAPARHSGGGQEQGFERALEQALDEPAPQERDRPADSKREVGREAGPDRADSSDPATAGDVADEQPDEGHSESPIKDEVDTGETDQTDGDTAHGEPADEAGEADATEAETIETEEPTSDGAEGQLAGPEGGVDDLGAEALQVFDLRGGADYDRTADETSVPADPAVTAEESDAAASADGVVEAEAMAPVQADPLTIAAAAAASTMAEDSQDDTTPADVRIETGGGGEGDDVASLTRRAETAEAITLAAEPAATVVDGEAMLELHGTDQADGESSALPASTPDEATGLTTEPGQAATTAVADGDGDGDGDEQVVAPAASASGVTQPGDGTGSGTEPSTGDAVVEAPVRPTQSAPTVAPIGSTQATVETVAAARTELPAAVANAQALADGIDAPEVWRQVQRAVGSLRTNTDGDQQMTIRLRPAELGSVVVRVIANETGTNVSVVAETSAAANQLNQQRQQLASELANNGLRGVSIDIGAQTGDGQAPDDAPEDDGETDGGAITGRDRRGRDGLADLQSSDGLRSRAGRAQLIDLDL